MKKTLLIIMLAVITASMAGVAMAGNFYVVKNATGQVAVVDYATGPEWVKVDGPYGTADAAKRANGIGTVYGSGPKSVLFPRRVEN
jgi:hypothetical protein